LGLFRMDLVVESAVVVELKSTERHDPLFEAQLLSYMKLGGYRVGLLVNFNSLLLTKGCLLYTSPSPRDRTRSRMPSSA
jgi:GxxExxY protein